MRSDVRTPHVLLTIAVSLAACGGTSVEPEKPELGHSVATSMAASPDDEQEPEAPSVTDASTKQRSPSTTTEAPVLSVKDAGARTLAVDASTAPATTSRSAPTTGSDFDAGAGTLLADGKTVEYHIPDGTGRKDWNPKDKPINVAHGMTLRLVDDDTTATGGGHWLHTYGQPCAHGAAPIGKGFDCKIRDNAPLGLIDGTFEHNIANAGGRIYIVVVKDAPQGGSETTLR